MKKRCQVCDGPIVNGRCKLCGMPYRNDEILYHLNENRRDHYSHATEKAREIMKQAEIPLSDKPQGTTRRAPAARPSYTYKRKPSASAKKETEKAKKTASWITILIIVVLVLLSIAPDLLEYVREYFGYPFESFF